MSARAWHRREISNLEHVTRENYERMCANFYNVQEAIQATALKDPMEALKAQQAEVVNWAEERGRREQDGTPLSRRALEFEAWLTASNEQSAKALKRGYNLASKSRNSPKQRPPQIS